MELRIITNIINASSIIEDKWDLNNGMVNKKSLGKKKLIFKVIGQLLSALFSTKLYILEMKKATHLIRQTVRKLYVRHSNGSFGHKITIYASLNIFLALLTKYTLDLTKKGERDLGSISPSF